MFGGHFVSGVFLAGFLCLPLATTDTCPAGPMPGLPGIPGFPGRDGREGMKGEKGELGIPLKPDEAKQKGEKGNIGIKGMPGKRGQGGDKGMAGPPGPQGEQGEPGDLTTTSSDLQSAFSVYRGTRLPPEPKTVIRFNNIIFNDQSHFSVDEGKFVCKIPGTYYFVFHASTFEKRLCVALMHNNNKLASFCDRIEEGSQQVNTGGLAVYLKENEKVWLETNAYNGMYATKGKADSVFSGFLIHAH